MRAVRRDYVRKVLLRPSCIRQKASGQRIYRVVVQKIVYFRFLYNFVPLPRQHWAAIDREKAASHEKFIVH